MFDFKPPRVEVSLFKGLLFGCLEIPLERDLVLDSPGIALRFEVLRNRRACREILVRFSSDCRVDLRSPRNDTLDWGSLKRSTDYCSLLRLPSSVGSEATLSVFCPRSPVPRRARKPSSVGSEAPPGPERSEVFRTGSAKIPSSQ